EELGKPVRDNLPGQPPAVLEPAARTGVAATLGERVPEPVYLGLVLGGDGEGNRLGERELRAAVEGREGAPGEREGHRHHRAFRVRHPGPVVADPGDL